MSEIVLVYLLRYVLTWIYFHEHNPWNYFLIHIADNFQMKKKDVTIPL